MTLTEKLEQDARDFMRRIDARRDDENARMFKERPAQATTTITVLEPKKIESPPRETEVVLFSPNSNAH